MLRDTLRLLTPLITALHGYARCYARHAIFILRQHYIYALFRLHFFVIFHEVILFRDTLITIISFRYFSATRAQEPCYAADADITLLLCRRYAEERHTPGLCFNIDIELLRRDISLRYGDIAAAMLCFSRCFITPFSSFIFVHAITLPLFTLSSMIFMLLFATILFDAILFRC